MSRRAHTLKTERLILREIRESDAEQIVEWRSNPAVYPYFKSPHALTKEEHLRWYRGVYLPDANRLDWLCMEADTEKAVGVFGLRKAAETPGSVEVSYLTAPEQQRKGYAAEAIRALVRYAAEAWGARTITAEIRTDNVPSVRLAEKLGFAFQKEEGLFSLFSFDLQKRKEG